MMNKKIEENKKPATAGKTRGRQKIEIKQLEKKNNLHVTFTKRRNGLFKKASELCILCGAKVGIIVLSPSSKQKPFCFGHPNIDTILDRYLNHQNNADVDDGPDNVDDGPDNDDDGPDNDDDGGYSITDLRALEEINKQYEESLKELEKEKKRGKEIEESKKVAGKNGGFWWDDIKAIHGMGVEELEAYMKAMEELKNNVIARASALTMANAMETSAQADHVHDPCYAPFGFFAHNSGFGTF